MKRILLVTDVYGWGGHERAKMIKKNLSDTYSFDIVDSQGLVEHVDKKLFGAVDINKFFKRKNFSSLITNFEKETKLNITCTEDIDDFVCKRFEEKKKRKEKNFNDYSIYDFKVYLTRWSRRRGRKNIYTIFNTYLKDIISGVEWYDLYYLMFHSMLKRHDVIKLMDIKQNVVSVVTGFPTLRKGMFDSLEHFKKLSNKCKAIFANNIMSLQDLKRVYGGPTHYVPRGVDPNVFRPLDKRSVNPTIITMKI